MKTKTVRSDGNLNSLLATIGQKLLELRIEKGYTSHADFASDNNLPRIQYWRMEKGRANITLKSLGKVLDIHGLTLEEFLGSILKDVKPPSAKVLE
jgi:transcriptional regulator with XRE-family HTH domain